LQEWLQMGTEKCAAIDQVPAQCGDRGVHGAAPAKDEKLEAFQWRAMTMDVEATWVRCRIQQMEARLAQQEQHNASLESILLDRERENKALKERYVASPSVRARMKTSTSRTTIACSQAAANARGETWLELLAFRWRETRQGRVWRGDGEIGFREG
jgi:hypothetical protein